MVTASDVFEASRLRPLALRKRPDLIVAEHVYRGEHFWLIKDPLEMEFYRLNEEEYAVLTLIDGETSLDQIKLQFEALFPPQRITHRELQSFISNLHSKSLLAYDSPEIGPHLLERGKEKRRKKIKQNLSSVLAIKFRGVDPDRFLNWLTPKVGWLFSLPSVIGALLLMAAALLWTFVHWNMVLARLPALSQFLQQQNWLLLGSVVVFMKVVHELAHGVSFKRYGGECHDIGVMLLLFVPTLYCNTSDSWLLRSKWKRAGIAAAGMYVELLIAAIATFVWWFSQPGTINMLALNIMATGSISVVLFNANPFLKYDGYYILADVLELPNLRERSGKMTQSWFLKYGLGIDEDAEPHSRFGTKLTLVLFNLASFCFRLAIVGLIVVILTDRLQPYGLVHLGLTIGVAACVGMFVPALWGLYQFFKVPGRLHRMTMKNSLPTLLVVAAIAGFVIAVPLPHRITCPLTVEPRDSQAVYVKHDAILKAVHVRPGQRVKKGELIAELENLDTTLTLTRLRAESRELAAELSLLERARDSSSITTARISDLQEALATKRESVRKYEQIVSSFRITAPRDGTVIPEWTDTRTDNAEELGTWDGAPLDPENVGTRLGSGLRICSVGDLKQLDAVLAVNEHDIQLVQVGQRAALLLDALSSRRLEGEIESLAWKEAEGLPASLASKYGGTIQLQRSAAAQSIRPSDEHFEARVSVPSTDVALSSGLRGQARVQVGSRTVYQRVKELLYRNLRKKM